MKAERSRKRSGVAQVTMGVRSLGVCLCPLEKTVTDEGECNPALIELEAYEGGWMPPLTMVGVEISKLYETGVEVKLQCRSLFKCSTRSIRVMEATVGDSELAPYQLTCRRAGEANRAGRWKRSRLIYWQGKVTIGKQSHTMSFSIDKDKSFQRGTNRRSGAWAARRALWAGCGTRDAG